MAWVPPEFYSLYGVTRENYVFIKCRTCKGVFRWGIYGFREGLIHCPYCGTIISKPQLVDKIEYIKFLQKMGSPSAIWSLQRRLWKPQQEPV